MSEITPEHNPAIAAGRFARALLAEASAVTRADVAARTSPVGALESSELDGAVVVRRRLLLAVVAVRDWRRQANCAGVDPDLFYPRRGGSKVLQAEQIREAKEVCAGCSVRAQCLTSALEHQEDHGIWGGLSERERRRLQTKLPRVARCVRCGGRYRKVAAGQKFCGGACPALARPRARSRAS